jgi:hypothetical protein
MRYTSTSFKTKKIRDLELAQQPSTKRELKLLELPLEERIQAYNGYYPDMEILTLKEPLPIRSKNIYSYMQSMNCYGATIDSTFDKISELLGNAICHSNLDDTDVIYEWTGKLLKIYFAVYAKDTSGDGQVDTYYIATNKLVETKIIHSMLLSALQ